MKVKTQNKLWMIFQTIALIMFSFMTISSGHLWGIILGGIILIIIAAWVFDEFM